MDPSVPNAGDDPPVDPDRPVVAEEVTDHFPQMGELTTFVVPESAEGRVQERIVRSLIDALAPRTAILLVLRGPGRGGRYLLDEEEISVGRASDSDLFIDDVTVSRRHATFFRTGEGYSVTDEGSLNGTYVDGERVDSVRLQKGDDVQIGKFHFRYFDSRR